MSSEFPKWYQDELNLVNISNDTSSGDKKVISFVSEWFDSSDILPLCYETGNWDGKKSDNFVGETFNGKQFLGCCFEGTIDGEYFYDWYQVDEVNGSDSLVEGVVRWLKIPF